MGIDMMVAGLELAGESLAIPDAPGEFALESDVSWGRGAETAPNRVKVGNELLGDLLWPTGMIGTMTIVANGPPPRDAEPNGRPLRQGRLARGNLLLLATGRRDRAQPLPFPSSPEGQRDFLPVSTQIVREIPGGRGKAVFWWEAATSGQVKARTLLDFDGNALPAVDAYRKILP